MRGPQAGRKESREMKQMRIETMIICLNFSLEGELLTIYLILFLMNQSEAKSWQTGSTFE